MSRVSLMLWQSNWVLQLDPCVCYSLLVWPSGSSRGMANATLIALRPNVFWCKPLVATLVTTTCTRSAPFCIPDFPLSARCCVATWTYHSITPRPWLIPGQRRNLYAVNMPDRLVLLRCLHAPTTFRDLLACLILAEV